MMTLSPITSMSPFLQQSKLPPTTVSRNLRPIASSLDAHSINFPIKRSSGEAPAKDSVWFTSNLFTYWKSATADYKQTKLLASSRTYRLRSQIARTDMSQNLVSLLSGLLIMTLLPQNRHYSSALSHTWLTSMSSTPSINTNLILNILYWFSRRTTVAQSTPLL